MSCSKWAYDPRYCDGGGCPGDCDLCNKPQNMEDEDDMSDYIKRKEYKLPNGRTVTADFNELGHATITIQAMDALFDILNSSDVVEIVRCKDCVYREVKGEGMTHWFGCRIMEHNDDDWYCSYGERAEE